MLDVEFLVAIGGVDGEDDEGLDLLTLGDGIMVGETTFGVALIGGTLGDSASHIIGVET